MAFLSHLQTYAKWYLLFLLGVLSIVLWRAVFREDRGGMLTFAVLDVGQGDALWIESPTGTQILVDGGPDRALMSALPRVLPWYDRHIDMIVVTNPDLDHYSGFIPLMDEYAVDLALEPGTTGAAPSYKVLENEISGKHISRVLARRGERIAIGGGAYLDILFPDRDVSGLSTNDGSIVMKLTYGATSVMLQGDSTARMEDYLLSLADASSTLSADILKAGHHGSKTSTSPEYVAAVRPHWVVASSGSGNKFGHPNQEVLDTLAADHLSLLDTCVMGDIIFHSDGQTFTLQNKKEHPVAAGCSGEGNGGR